MEEASAYPGFPEYAGYSAVSGTSTVTPDSRDVPSGDGEKRRRRPVTAVVSRLRAVFEPSTNRLSMKIYGSEKAVLKERLRQRSLGFWVIHPCSNFRCVPTWTPIYLRMRRLRRVKVKIPRNIKTSTKINE